VNIDNNGVERFQNFRIVGSSSAPEVRGVGLDEAVTHWAARIDERLVTGPEGGHFDPMRTIPKKDLFQIFRIHRFIVIHYGLVTIRCNCWFFRFVIINYNQMKGWFVLVVISGPYILDTIVIIRNLFCFIDEI